MVRMSVSKTEDVVSITAVSAKKKIASGDARCVRHSVTVFNQVGSNPIRAAKHKFLDKNIKI